MAIERTFSILKPDATKRNLTGKINAYFEAKGLKIVAQKRLRLTPEMAGAFYAEHKARPFYNDLVTFMSSAPVIVQVLEGDVADGHRDRERGEREEPALPDPTLPPRPSDGHGARRGTPRASPTRSRTRRR
jgi:hypothetical protein